MDTQETHGIGPTLARLIMVGYALPWFALYGLLIPVFGGRLPIESDGWRLAASFLLAYLTVAVLMRLLLRRYFSAHEVLQKALSRRRWPTPREVTQSRGLVAENPRDRLSSSDISWLSAAWVMVPIAIIAFALIDPLEKWSK